MNKRARLRFAAFALITLGIPALAQSAPLDPRTATYELRIYYPAPGKMDALNARFREHTLKIFEKHGMTNVAYWNEPATPAAPNGRLVYVLAFPDKAARDADWEAFRTDPEWLAVVAASEAGGKLVEKIDSSLMSLTDYSPPPTLSR